MEKTMSEEAMEFLRSRKKMNLAIVIANIAVFLVLELLGNTNDTEFMIRHGAMVIPMELPGADSWRLLTCMFLHFGLEHLAYNMVMLIFLGDMLESAVGGLRYLVIYLGGGLAGNIISAYLGTREMMRRSFDYEVAMAGASGAVFAALGGLVVVAWKNRRKLGQTYRRRLAIMTVLSLFGGLRDPGVDHVAHFGGFVSGVALCLLLYRRGKNKEIG